jgi:hypothetical protein
MIVSILSASIYYSFIDLEEWKAFKRQKATVTTFP